MLFCQMIRLEYGAGKRGVSWCKEIGERSRPAAAMETQDDGILPFRETAVDGICSNDSPDQELNHLLLGNSSLVSSWLEFHQSTLKSLMVCSSLAQLVALCSLGKAVMA